MAKANSLDEVVDYLPEVTEMVRQAKQDLRNGHVPLEELVITQSLSRAVEGYTFPSPAARVAMQLQATGLEVAPGQFMRFVYSREGAGPRLGVGCGCEDGGCKKILYDAGSGSIWAGGYV